MVNVIYEKPTLFQRRLIARTRLVQWVKSIPRKIRTYRMQKHMGIHKGTEVHMPSGDGCGIVIGFTDEGYARIRTEQGRMIVWCGLESLEAK